MIRRQLPVYSPLSLRALVATALEVPFDIGRSKAALRQRIAAELHVRSVLLTETGTAALQMALLGASRMSSGAPVALPAFGCYDLATAAVGAGVRVLLYDVNPWTLAPNLASLSAALSAGAKTVVCASLYGLPTMTRFCVEMAEDAGAVVVVDGAQAWGAKERGRAYASQGSLAIVSFGRGKGYTGGGGGALLACDERGLRILNSLPKLGRARLGGKEWLSATAQWLMARPSIYGIPCSIPVLHLGETIFHSPGPARPMARAAAMLLRRTARAAAAELETRRRNAGFLRSLIAGHPTLRTPAVDAEDEPGYLRLPVLDMSSAGFPDTTDDAGALGIARAYPRPLSELPGFANTPVVLNSDATFDGASLLASRLITLPTHSRLTRMDLEKVGKWIYQRRAERGSAGAVIRPERVPRSRSGRVRPTTG